MKENENSKYLLQDRVLNFICSQSSTKEREQIIEKCKKAFQKRLDSAQCSDNAHFFASLVAHGAMQQIRAILQQDVANSPMAKLLIDERCKKSNSTDIAQESQNFFLLEHEETVSKTLSLFLRQPVDQIQFLDLCDWFDSGASDTNAGDTDTGVPTKLESQDEKQNNLTRVFITSRNSTDVDRLGAAARDYFALRALVQTLQTFVFSDQQ